MKNIKGIATFLLTISTAFYIYLSLFFKTTWRKSGENPALTRNCDTAPADKPELP
jgi:hypothetical protein